jgi:hypothetical protein
VRILSLFGSAFLVVGLSLCLSTTNPTPQTKPNPKFDLEQLDRNASPYDTCVMLEGLYYAASRMSSTLYVEKKYWEPRLPKALGQADWGIPGQVSLVAFPWEAVKHDFYPWRTDRHEVKRGFAVRLANRTNQPVNFLTCDHRMNLVQEAKDAKGQWQPIEYHQLSGCGNSYFDVTLKPNEYWAFSAPSYDGPFETTIRFRLEYDGIDNLQSPVIYSNEFMGRIHPEQFVVPPLKQ